ncbi:hypothetical protein MMC14_003716 [Varicellaria rhodocarpa]|nr:hypothetical protein [Varicellaria rhodocarpa]
MSFDYPDSQEIKDFWLTICHMEGENGSVGPPKTLSGWVTAFCFWTEKGKCLHLFEDKFSYYKDHERLELDGVQYHLLFPDAFPKGVLSVPFAIKDYGTRTKYQTTMIAGSVGMTATKVGDNHDEVNMQPRSGWWVLKDH